LLLMAALLVADEVFDYRQQFGVANGASPAGAGPARSGKSGRRAEPAEGGVVDARSDIVTERKGAA
jgi:hypothetical protein